MTRLMEKVDALPPDVLARLIRTEFAAFVDGPKMKAVLRREKALRAKLQKFATEVDE